MKMVWSYPVFFFITRAPAGAKLDLMEHLVEPQNSLVREVSLFRLLDLLKPRNSLERELMFGRFLDVQVFLSHIGRCDNPEIFSLMYGMGAFRALKSLELLDHSCRMLALSSHCQNKKDTKYLELVSNIASNVSYHLSRLSSIYMEGARMIANRILGCNNNCVNTRLDKFTEFMSVDPGDNYLLEGGVVTDDTFSRFLNHYEASPVFQTVKPDPGFLKYFGFNEGIHIMHITPSEVA